MNPQPKPALRYTEGQWSAAVPVPTVVSDTWPKAADVETAPDAALIPLPPQLDPNLKSGKTKSKKKERDKKRKLKPRNKDDKKNKDAKAKKKDGKGSKKRHK